MKIIFNHTINDWYIQIYDELSKHHELILPENYKNNIDAIYYTDLNALEKCIEQNSDIDFIFDFDGTLLDLIKWNKRKINVPLIIFLVNGINRPYAAKKSVFAKIWYVEQYAKPLLEKYNRKNLIYEGIAANPYIFRPLGLNKIFDLSFFGQHYGERKVWLDILQKLCLKNNIKSFFPIGHGRDLPWSFEDINKLYNQTKINISFAPKEPPGRIVNLRNFEICMSGNFQLMQYTPCIKEYFEVGKEIICWKNKKDLFEKILYYMENEDEREKIAKNGYKRAIKDHTWSKRFEKIATFLRKKRRKLDVEKYLIDVNQFLAKKEMQKVYGLQSNKSKSVDLKILEVVLRKFGYKIRKDLKYKRSLKIAMKDKFFIYKPNLKNYRFIEFYGKIMMIIKLVPLNSEIKSKDWEDLKKLLYLIENLDTSLPEFGLLTNGYEWLMRDFRNNKWLKNFPTRKLVKKRSNLKSFIILRLIIFTKTHYRFFNLTKIIPLFCLKIYLKSIYDKFDFLLRKLLKTPPPRRWS